MQRHDITLHHDVTLRPDVTSFAVRMTNRSFFPKRSGRSHWCLYRQQLAKRILENLNCIKMFSVDTQGSTKRDFGYGITIVLTRTRNSYRFVSTEMYRESLNGPHKKTFNRNCVPRNFLSC